MRVKIPWKDADGNVVFTSASYEKVVTTDTALTLTKCPSGVICSKTDTVHREELSMKQYVSPELIYTYCDSSAVLLASDVELDMSEE